MEMDKDNADQRWESIKQNFPQFSRLYKYIDDPVAIAPPPSAGDDPTSMDITSEQKIEMLRNTLASMDHPEEQLGILTTILSGQGALQEMDGNMALYESLAQSETHPLIRDAFQSAYNELLVFQNQTAYDPEMAKMNVVSALAETGNKLAEQHDIHASNKLINSAREHLEQAGIIDDLEEMGYTDGQIEGVVQGYANFANIAAANVRTLQEQADLKPNDTKSISLSMDKNHAQGQITQSEVEHGNVDMRSVHAILQDADFKVEEGFLSRAFETHSNPPADLAQRLDHHQGLSQPHDLRVSGHSAPSLA
jgi:hypothetical protein